MTLQGHLYHPKRYITTHDSGSGKAVIDTTIPADAPFYALGDGVAEFAQCYTTEGFPVNISDNVDVEKYETYLKSPPGIVISNGTVLRYVDMAPGKTSPMHQTVSLDYGVVMEGEVELILNSGETRLMKRGDVCIQRGTMHAWRNTSETEWSRMMYILQPIEPIVVAGKKLKEDLGGMHGVDSSK
jgi:quercetin dioxygenase-like cupin family protein